MLMSGSRLVEEGEMAKARSPEYPAIGLGEAINKAKQVYGKDYQNKLSKAVIAEHMGYKSLSGTSLPILASLSKYGLLEGRGDETHISDLALAIIAHERGTPERGAAIKTAAASPELFSELDRQFPNGKASDAALRSYLLNRKFIPSAADTAIRSYRETKELVNAESALYHPDKVAQELDAAGTGVAGKKEREPETAGIGDYVQVEIGGAFQLDEPKRLRAVRQHDGKPWAFVEGSETGIPMEQIVLQSKGGDGGPAAPPTLPEDKPPTKPGMKEEKNSLDEGEAVLLLPENLSAASVKDLEYWLQGVLKKAKRRAGLRSPDMRQKLAATIKANMIAMGAPAENVTDDAIASLVDEIE